MAKWKVEGFTAKSKLKRLAQRRTHCYIVWLLDTSTEP